MRNVLRAHRRRASARRECCRPAADVRVPRLLSAVHRYRCAIALPRGPGPVSGIPGFRAGPSRVVGAADPGRHGVLFQELRTRAHRRLLPRSGRCNRIRAGPRRLERHQRGRPPGRPADRRRGSAAGPGPPDTENAQPQSYLVPIDACYEFVGRLRMLWRGFDGGQQARQFIDDFFAQIAARARETPR